MRKFYRSRRNRIVSSLEKCPYADRLTIQELDAGLHFLVKVDTDLSDEDLVTRLSDAGIRVRTLSSYYHDNVHRDSHCLVVNYSSLREESLESVTDRLSRVFG
jgi:GntR family transcriptional regulator/MocR family aminotransferase